MGLLYSAAAFELKDKKVPTQWYKCAGFFCSKQLPFCHKQNALPVHFINFSAQPQWIWLCCTVRIIFGSSFLVCVCVFSGVPYWQLVNKGLIVSSDLLGLYKLSPAVGALDVLLGSGLEGSAKNFNGLLTSGINRSGWSKRLSTLGHRYGLLRFSRSPICDRVPLGLQC